jgi:hypothetical protein
MKSLLDEFQYRRSFITNMNCNEVDARLSGFLDWLESNEATSSILTQIENETRVAELLKKADYNLPPVASSPEDFVQIGIHFIREVKAGKPLWGLSNTYGIHPSYNTTSIQAMVDEIVDRYIDPAVDYLQMKVAETTQKDERVKLATVIRDATETIPPEIKISLQKFREDHPVNQKSAFIIMQFSKTIAHQNIVEAIKKVSEKHGIVALRADDKEYHSSLLGNVLTYIYGCDMSIAVFERIEADIFNPNVSFEVGYMRGLNKPICLLKDQTMRTLQTDLLGELYKSFDPQDPKGSIPSELEKWFMDKEIV